MAEIDISTFQAVNNNNLKTIGEQPAIYSNFALRNAVEAQEALSQLGRSQLQAHQQSMAGMSNLMQQLQVSAQAAMQQAQMVALASASKVAEDLRSLDPKDARAEGLLLDPALYAGRDVSAMRSIIREEVVAALVSLSKAPESSKSPA